MILILSQDRDEPTTEDVMDWIDFHGNKVSRLNGADFYKHIFICISPDNSEFKLPNISLDKIKAVWLRRWLSPKNSSELVLSTNGDKVGKTLLQINEFLKSEFRVLSEYLFDLFPKWYRLSSHSYREINKLKVLGKAKEYGLRIPKTHIFTSKNAFENNVPKEDMIVKPISNAPNIRVGGDSLAAYTTRYEGIPESLNQLFSPSLCQEHIEKKYEIRSFYLSGKFYSMAIFSQQNKQTETDFRVYDYEKPNRLTCFSLPEEIESKLKSIAEFFELNACSFDLIRTLEGEYIFLEVNPNGQFGMVSYPCNYGLEELVALDLIKIAKKNNEKN